MTGRPLTLLAWSMWALSFVLLALGVHFSFLTRAVPDPNAFGLTFDALLSAALLAFPTVGALVASRRRGNAIGRPFCVVGVLFGVQSAAYGWGSTPVRPTRGTARRRTGGLALDLAVRAGPFLIPVYLFLLFPDGRPLSRQWRPVAWLAGAGLLATTLGSALPGGRSTNHHSRRSRTPPGLPAAVRYWTGRPLWASG